MDRVCIRGCIIPKRHIPTCLDSDQSIARLVHAVFPGTDRCEGCLPRPAYDGALLCESCIRKTRRALEDAADLCGHIRTLIDPRKSGWNFDREQLSSGGQVHAPAPMNVAMVDAADQIIITMTWWASYYGAEWSWKEVANGWPSTITPERAFDIADEVAVWLIENLPMIANDSHVAGFTDKVIGWPAGDEWSIQKALKRFPMDQRGHWSTKPCPDQGCGKRTIWITPPRQFGQRTRYVCKACEWEPPILEHAIWAEYFVEKKGEKK